MADSAKDGMESDVAKELRKTAEDEVAKAMTGAMSNLPMPGDEGNEVKQQSSFLRKNLSVTPEHAEEEVDYVEPMPDPYGKAIKYLEQHNVMQLFQVSKTETGKNG